MPCYRSIRSKLIFAFLAAFTPLAVLHFASYYEQYQTRKDLILQSHSAVSNSVASTVTIFIESIIASHNTVARTVDQGSKERTLYRRLRSICAANPCIKSSCILSKDGSLVCDYPQGSVSAAVMQKPEVARIINGDMLSITGLLTGQNNRPVFVVASVVAQQDGEPLIVRSIVDAGALRRLIPSSVYYRYYVFIVDAKGRVILHPKDTTTGSGWRKYPFIAKSLEGSDAPIDHLHVPSMDADVLGYVAPIRKAHWAVVVLQPEAEGLEVMWRSHRELFMISVFVTVVGLIGVVFLGNHITSPVRRLSRAAAAVAVGDFRKRIEVNTGDEFTSLAASFNSMAESLERHENELTDKTAALEGLFRVAKAATSSLDLNEILRSLVTVTCEVMGAHACAIFVVNEDGTLDIRESHNLSDNLRYNLHPRVGEGCVGRAIQEKRWMVCDDTTKGHCPGVADLVVDEGLASALSAPLIGGNTAFGALTIWTSMKTEFSSLQTSLLSSIAGYAATVIQNAQLYVKEYNTAEALQHGLLSTVPDELSGLRFGSRYYPALDDARVGGDFYDVVQLPDNKIGVVIADVSGKGLKAAIHTAACKYMLRGFAFAEPTSPAAVFRMLNEALCHYGEYRFFVTAFYAVIDLENWTMTYANAGHPPPALLKCGGEHQVMLGKTGVPLGFEPMTEYSECEVKLDEGSGVFMYTDGIIEARGSDGMLEIEGLQDMLFDASLLEPQQLVDRICEDVNCYAKGMIRDDVAVVAFMRAGDG